MDAVRAGAAKAELQNAEAEHARAALASMQTQQLSLSDWAQVQRAMNAEITDLLRQRSEIAAQRDSYSCKYEELQASHEILAAQVVLLVYHICEVVPLF